MPQLTLNRFLILDDRLEEVGHSDGDDRFRMNEEFFQQALMACQQDMDISDWRLLSDAEAQQLADWLEAHLPDQGWQIHLAAWGDDDGTTTKTFIDFLRGGRVAVVKS